MRFEPKLDRCGSVPLADQMVTAIKTAVMRGEVRPGEALPSIRELAMLTGTSEKVPRTALARLAAEGWTAPRCGVGSVILDRGANIRFKGNVLLFSRAANFGIYQSQFLSTIRSRLVRAGYRVTISTSSVRDADGCVELEDLLRQHWDLIIDHGYVKHARQLIEASGWPFVVLDAGVPIPSSSAANCCGRIGIRMDMALGECVCTCVRRNVRRVVQFLLDGTTLDVGPRFRQVGIEVEDIKIPLFNSLERIAMCALRRAEDFLTRRRSVLPDLVFISDDHIARGVMTALLARGIRVPEDIRVVSSSNKGFGVIWPTPVTRLEMDPIGQGVAVAKMLIAFLKTGCFPPNLILGSVWKRGKTF